MPQYLDTTLKQFPFAALSHTMDMDEDGFERVHSLQTLLYADDDWEIVEDPQELKRVLSSELAYARTRNRTKKNRSRN
jgi:hypothetical protein